MSEVLNSRSSKYRRTLMTKRSGVQIPVPDHLSHLVVVKLH